MRKAAGILMIIVGMVSVVLGVAFLSEFDITDPLLSFMVSFALSFIILALFLVTGGVFCLRRRHWKLCFTSALLPVVLMIFWVLVSRFSPWLAWFWYLIPMGIVAIIFVYLSKREWSESQA